MAEHAEADVDLEVARLLAASGIRLATAESCTGGLVGHRLTNVSGSSAYYLGGVIAYSNDVKRRELGVDAGALASHGAVSEPVARQMAAGVRGRFEADVGIGITGIAGPGGGSEEKPVGLVYLGLDAADGGRVQRLVLTGTREEIKCRAATAALTLLRDWLRMKGSGHG